MARNKAPLSVAEIRKLKPGKRHPVGRRLYADVGVGTWYARLGVRGAETFRRIADVEWSRLEASLQDAHILNAELQAAYARGEDPKAVLSAKAAHAGGTTPGGRVTFSEAVKIYIEAHKDEWSNELHATQWQDTLDTYCKTLARKAVADITVQDVQACMAGEWKRIPTTMQRTLARMKRVFDLCISEGWRQAGNPAELGPIKAKLGDPPREERHHAALDWRKLPALMRQLEALQGDDAETADCLRYIILTGARLQEGRDVVRGEIDLEAARWIVPSKRMKKRKAHRVPLSRAALDLIEDRPRRPNDRMFAVSRSAPYELLDKLGLKGEATVHGFRASLDCWASDNKIADPEAIEAALAHRKRDKTTRAYRRTDFYDQRVPLMDAWAKFLAGK